MRTGTLPQHRFSRRLSAPEFPPFARRAWLAAFVVAAMAGVVVVLWLAYEVALMFLAAVLLAIFLTTIADWVSRKTRLSPGASLAVTVLALLAAAGVTGWFLTARIAKEITELSSELPKAMAKLETALEAHSWGKIALSRLQSPNGALAQTGNLLKRAQTLLSISLNGVIDVWVIVAAGFYLSLRPQFYLNGFLRLVPVKERQRAGDLLLNIGGQLRHWLFGQMVSMAILGVSTWLGLLLLRVPASGLLGVLAGLLDFLPVAGPFIAGILSCLVAAGKDPIRAVYVACMFCSLHLIEVHFIIPQVQRRAAQLPPALTILAMVLFYTLFGFFGLLLAVPLLALAIITIRSLYIEDVLEHSRG